MLPNLLKMPNKNTDKKARNRNIIALLWCGFATLMVLIVLFFILVYNGVIGYMPPVEELKNPRDRFASIL